MGKSVGKSSRAATILSLGIDHRTAVDLVPISVCFRTSASRQGTLVAIRETQD